MAEVAVFSSKVQQLLAVVEASGFALQQDGKVRRRGRQAQGAQNRSKNSFRRPDSQKKTNAPLLPFALSLSLSFSLPLERALPKTCRCLTRAGARASRDHAGLAPCLRKREKEEEA